ncbi:MULTISPECIES: PilZ domain-containing protein [Thalassobaculum]|mgnify:CR=1 FL=1|uniref:PilZ domain-containing protein n=1 Tax=Thalassobaculum litoreum DSM 18839 TaxID=1123362 RepID=A0A8G2BGT6_9PROT|nr:MULTISPECIES: PilZ domain-containing protein [Thalassobaculum]SDF23497.1 PilZ domain-containing protein [Thalassobaculum litoreum DSM 18839]
MSIVTWIRGKLSKSTPGEGDRRRNERYPVSSGLEIIVDGVASDCRVDNVSAGGVRVLPAVAAPLGAVVTVRDPATGMSLDGEVLGHEGGGTRLRFASEDAGIIVSTWMRMAAEDGPRPTPG